MTANIHKTNKWLLSLIAILVAVVGIQSYFLIRDRDNTATPRSISLRPDKLFDHNFGFPATDPFREMEQMRRTMDRLFENSFQEFKIDPLLRDAFSDQEMTVTDKGDRYLVRLNIPGVDQADLNITVEGQTLKVSGNRKETREHKDNRGIVRKEMRNERFERSQTLPGPVQADKMQVSRKNDVLTVILPKADHAVPSIARPSPIF
ncbi:MAG: Hsp20/alpha crystallin family protein [Nitrospinales bacterium]